MENNINRLREEFSDQIHALVDDFSHRIERLTPEYHRRKERESRLTVLTVLLAVLVGGALLVWRSVGYSGEAKPQHEEDVTYTENTP
jgi:type VI protein secretion system component VasF